MNILLINVKITATRNTDAIMKVEIFASTLLLIAEVEKYMKSGPKTKPTVLALIAPACSQMTFLSPTRLATMITGTLIPVLRTAKVTCAKSDGAARNCAKILIAFGWTVSGTT